MENMQALLTEITTTIYKKNKDHLLDLLKSNPNLINNVFDDSSTLLHIACEAKWPEGVEILTELGADLNSENALGNTPLLEACKSKEFTIANYLVDKGADPNVNNCSKTAVIHLAAEGNNLDLVIKCLEAGADIDQEDYDLMTALLYALENGNKVIAKYLIVNGADLSDPADILEETIDEDIGDIITLLASKGCDLNAIEDFGFSPLINAIESESINCVNALLNAGVDLDSKDENGNTPLHVAVKHGQFETVKLLLDAKADANMTNNDNDTPLRLAYFLGGEEGPKIEDLLVKYYVDNKTGLTIPFSQKDPDSLIIDNRSSFIPSLLITLLLTGCGYKGYVSAKNDTGFQVFIGMITILPIMGIIYSHFKQSFVLLNKRIITFPVGPLGLKRVIRTNAVKNLYIGVQTDDNGSPQSFRLMMDYFWKNKLKRTYLTSNTDKSIIASYIKDIYFFCQMG